MLEQIEASALEQLGDSLDQAASGSASASINIKDVQVRVRRRQAERQGCLQLQLLWNTHGAILTASAFVPRY